jgi:hypothetical protein
MIERNPIEYKYNSLVSSIIRDNKFIEYNEIENKYYLNEIAYKVIYFERKYREYVQQLPVLMKGMQAYGYQLSSFDLGELSAECVGVFRDVKNLMRQAYDERVSLNTSHIEELMDIIEEDRLSLYKEVLAGKYDIRKGDEWRDDLTNQRLIVKNIEVFEKVVPIFISLSKQYQVEQIREIFEFCRHKGGSFNFAAIKRIRTLVNILYNDKNDRLDLPIKEFMIESYEFSEYKSCKKIELENFIRNFVIRFVRNASTREILIERSILTIKDLIDKFTTIFKCLVKVSRPTKNGMINMERIEVLWKERDSYNTDISDKVFILNDFIDAISDSEISDIDGNIFEEA